MPPSPCPHDPDRFVAAPAPGLLATTDQPGRVVAVHGVHGGASACERCPALRPDPAQRPRLEEIISNLQARLAEAKQQGWLGEVVRLEASLAGAEQKLKQMQHLAAQPQGVTMLGTPVFRPATPRPS